MLVQSGLSWENGPSLGGSITALRSFRRAKCSGVMKVEGPDGEIKDSCGNENTLNVLGCTKARPVQKVSSS